MYRLYRGGPRLLHPDHTPEFVQVAPDQRGADAGQAPHFRPHVKWAHLEGSKADYGSGLDQSGHDNVVAGTNDLGVAMLADYLPEGTFRIGLPVSLEPRHLPPPLPNGASNPADDLLSRNSDSAIEVSLKTDALRYCEQWNDRRRFRGANYRKTM